MKYLLIAFTAAGLLLFSASAWPASTKQEVIELKAQVAEMQKDLAEIKKLLQEGAQAQPQKPKRPPFQEQVVSIGSAPVMGEENAPITLMEFSDYQCPYCARIYRDVMPTLEEEYIKTGKLKFVMREYPLESIHPDAMDASIAALCADDQGKYWEMHRQLFDNQRQLGIDQLKAYAESIGLDATSFAECLDGRKYEDRVRADLALGKQVGVSGTPAMLIGFTDPEDPDKVRMTKFLRGAQQLRNYKGHIDNLLRAIPE